MDRIDAHQHFWEFRAEEYPWIRADWPLRRDFLPLDLEPILEKHGMAGCIAVQARHTIRETEWLLQLAERHEFIKGVVGWVDLRSKAGITDLERLSKRDKLVGVRHVAQDEVDDRFLVGSDFLRGIERLKSFNLAYDILVYPRQLPAAIELVRRFPEQRFVLDHLAKPPIKERQFEPWASDMRKLAAQPNVACKVSGMVTEADWKGWSRRDFHAYLDLVVELFGEDRLIYGSDWPVCLLAADYGEVLAIVEEYFEHWTGAARQKLYRDNAVSIYKLNA